MKKIIVVFAMLVFGLPAFAQEGTKKPAASTQTDVKAMPTTVVMKAGKVWLSKEGTMTVLEQEIKLNGTLVKPDGSVTLRDGKVTQLKEGDRVTAEGELIMVAKRDTPQDRVEPEK